MVEDGPEFLIGRDFFLGDRLDLTECDCAMCTEFRARLLEEG